MIDDETINVWRINYCLLGRSPAEALKWWNDRNRGLAPAGAVAALGTCLDEINRLNALIARAADMICAANDAPLWPEYAEKIDQVQRLLQAESNSIREHVQD
jgi:hypothetical protein